MRNTFPNIFWPLLKSGFLVVFRIWRSTAYFCITLHFQLEKGNGVVDFGEFVNMMINQNNNTLDEKELLEAFRTFDGDDKGYIFSNEIRYVMRHMGESIPEQDINEILQDSQESRKRKITFEGNRVLIRLTVRSTRFHATIC